MMMLPTVTLHRHPDNHTHCNCENPLGFGSINWQPAVRRDRRPQAWLWNRVAVETCGKLVHSVPDVSLVDRNSILRTKAAELVLK